MEQQKGLNTAVVTYEFADKQRSNCMSEKERETADIHTLLSVTAFAECNSTCNKAYRSANKYCGTEQHCDSYISTPRQERIPRFEQHSTTCVYDVINMHYSIA